MLLRSGVPCTTRARGSLGSAGLQSSKLLASSPSTRLIADRSSQDKRTIRIACAGEIRHDANGGHRGGTSRGEA